jgi:rhodanese-related sulfurtransferase
MASEKMVDTGYTGEIKRMEGGFLAWDAAGYDTENG